MANLIIYIVHNVKRDRTFSLVYWGEKFKCGFKPFCMHTSVKQEYAKV